MARGHQVLVLLILLVLALVLLDVVLLETPHRLANQLVAAAYMGRAPRRWSHCSSRVAQDAYKTPLAEYQAKASWAYWAYGRMAELVAAGLVGATALAKLHPATQRYVGRGQRWWPALPLLAGALVGFTVAIRPIGGLAGLLVSGFALWRLRGRAWAVVAIYASAAAVVAYLAWPYLWPAPLPRFLSGLGFSVAFDPKPTQFRGRIVRGDALPWDYFPTLAAIQLTEPISVLFLVGLGAAIGRWRARDGRPANARPVGRLVARPVVRSDRPGRGRVQQPPPAALLAAGCLGGGWPRAGLGDDEVAPKCGPSTPYSP